MVTFNYRKVLGGVAVREALQGDLEREGGERDLELVDHLRDRAGDTVIFTENGSDDSKITV